MTRREAFRRVRQIVGKEVCPTVARTRIVLEQAGAKQMADELAVVSTTTHQLRHALVALLVLHSEPGLTSCPNCKRKLPLHEARCIVPMLLPEETSRSSCYKPG